MGKRLTDNPSLLFKLKSEGGSTQGLISLRGNQGNFFPVGVAAVFGAALTAIVILFPTLGLIFGGLLLGASLYFYVARRLNVVLAGLLLVSLGGLLLPRPVRGAAEAGLALLAFGYTLRSIMLRQPGRRVAVLAVSTVVLWSALALNPNVPSVGVALLGVRKSTMLFVGIALGAAWPLGKSKTARSGILLLLSAAAVLALTIHVMFPSLENSLPRNAGVYTGQFAGSPRMQGMFAGPFHVSLLGSFLVLAGWQRLLLAQYGKAAGFLMTLIGLPLVVLSQVRAGLLTCFAGIAFLTLFARAPFSSRRRVAATGMILGVVLLAVLSPLELPADPALSSLASIETDHRALSRLETWRESIHLFLSSPIYGWGPGSAGDTLGPLFAGGHHVTSHNVILKFAVEGGLLGLGLVSAVIMIVRKTALDDFSGGPHTAAILALGGMGLTGAIIEASPVSVALGILIGLRQWKCL